jgi:Holliday junction resolvase RusA-like endonuclease
LRDDAPTFKTSKPDSSNLAKFVEDALQPYFYKDDSQIIELKAEKYYISQGEKPRTEVMIDEI